jgi:hypothetical protein
MQPLSLGARWLEPYDHSPFRLRFELGGEIFWQVTHVVPRFIQALERSMALADAVFESGNAIGVVGWSLEGGGLEALRSLGFTCSGPISEWSEIPFRADPDEGPIFSWNAFDLTESRQMRNALLWAANACEISIEPKADVISCLFNPQSQVVLYVYDDRGMDIVALDPAALSDIRRRFDSWILDGDRARIEDAFGPLNL